MLRLLILTAIALSPACLAADESYEDRWVRLANEHLALIKVEPGKSYERELIVAHNRFWKDVSAKCAKIARKGKIKEFHAVAVVDEDGWISEFLVMPQDKALKCYEEEMVGRRYPKPPSAPFYELLRVKL